MQEHLTFKDYLIDICKLLIDIPYCVYLLINCLIGSLIKRLTTPEKDLTSETVLVRTINLQNLACVNVSVNVDM